MDNITVFMTNHMGLFYILAITMTALMIVEFLRAKRGQARLEPAQAVLLINKENAVVIDIRNNETYRKGHIVDAVCMPAKELETTNKKLDKYKNKPMILVCNNGQDSQKAAASLAKNGYNAFVLSGGMRAWSSASLPTVKE